MKSKTIRDYCDIGILKAAYNLEIDQTIFVKGIKHYSNITVYYKVLNTNNNDLWTIVSESSNNEDFSNVNFDISKSNNSNDKDLIESCSKKIRIDKAEHEIVWWPCKIRFSNDEKRYFKGKRIYI
ncbi:hypothetical protein FG386_002821, partial [Cryptosporidium ryanae]|uniref:uncharacterized protein n=1 Tax=Cryptosporidium ryanae TaxID=515981 RepID=UPI00351A62E0